MPIRVAIVGVGNCAKSFVEGIGFYTKNPADTTGLMHAKIGNYLPADITFVAAFDVDSRKVGKPLHEAIASEPNKTLELAKPLSYPVIVQRGPTEESIIPEMRAHFIHESDKPAVDVANALKESNAEIVVNYLPTGSDRATYAYAEAALRAGCSFINCMPTPIAKDAAWRKRFEEKGLVLLGDDIKSQCGATIANRVLLSLLKMRGIAITKSDQTNFGGNADHYNLHFRPHAKEASKEAALNSVLDSKDEKPAARMIYTEKNYDHKRASIFIQGEMFGKSPLALHLILDDEDSPNSGGVVVDAIRATKVLVEQKAVASASELCAFLMKAPLAQYEDTEALHRFDVIINRKRLA